MHCMWRSVTHLGRMRGKNEDALVTYQSGVPNPHENGACELDRGFLIFGVCDGLGGSEAGDIASAVAAEEVVRAFEKKPLKVDSLPEVKRFLQEMLGEIHRRVFDIGIKVPEWRGLGTTLSVMFCFPEFAVIAHIGDSRIYRLRKRKLEQLTTDQTVAGRLWQDGSISEEELKHHAQRHVLEQVIGGDEPDLLKPQVLSLEIMNDDIFLFCTDGLSNGVSDDEIVELLSGLKHEETALEDTVSDLLEAALDNYGKDNISIVLASFKKTKVPIFGKIFGRK